VLLNHYRFTTIPKEKKMIIVGELINASRKAIAEAIEKEDAAAIQKIATDEHDNGADYIDVNAGIFVGKEVDYLKWLTTTVQDAVDGPCSIDSPSKPLWRCTKALP
jgi:5-methyltetrahydrofolate--homocysteine methyltransferase